MGWSPQKLAWLKKHLAELEPDIKQPDILLAKDTKFGIVDDLFLEKAKPDKNGVYSNVKIIKQSFDSMKS